MNVIRVEDSIWEIHEGQKWWTVALRKSGKWTITTGVGIRDVNPAGKLGAKLITAIRAHNATINT